MALLKDILAFEIEQYQNFTIEHGVMRSGAAPRQEFSLVSADVREGTLHGSTIWHEDVGDPGDSVQVLVTLKLEGAQLAFYVYDNQETMGEPVILVREEAE